MEDDTNLKLYECLNCDRTWRSDDWPRSCPFCRTRDPHNITLASDES